MSTWVAFLRAVNLGAKRVFPKDDIRRVTEEAGFIGVATHINTGNVRLDTSLRSREKIEKALERAYLEDRGFDVPVIAFRADEFTAVATDAAELAAENPGLARHYVYLLKHEPSADQRAALDEAETSAGRMVVRGRAAHALLLPGYQDGVVDPLGAVKHLGITTNRTATVIAALAAKWC